MSYLIQQLHAVKNNLFTFFKWLLLATLIGTSVGLIGTLFHYSIDYATEFRLSHPWIVYLLPIGGLLIVFLYKISHMADDRGTNLILLSVRSEEKLSLKIAPLIFISTVITHLFGGSSGREGAALQLGGSIAYKWGKLFKLDEKDLRLITMCGMSAAFSALFRTPLTATIFAMEVISVGIMYYAALVPCSLAAIIGYTLSGALGVKPTAFTLLNIPKIDFITTIQVIFLAAICAVVSILFCLLLHKTGHLYKKYLKNQYYSIAVGGLLVIILSFILQTTDYQGAGMSIISQSMSGKVVPTAFILKMLFTAITLGAGFRGGEIVPSFFVGATLGNTVSSVIGLNTSLGAGLGLIALFCGVTNCPLTSLIMSIELFGAEGSLYFMLVVAVSYMLSGYYGLYSKQKIMYSKTKTEFIDQLSQ